MFPTPRLYEVWNGHPWVNNLGGRDERGRVAPSAEALWDSLLSRGKVLFGAATDDAHEYQPARVRRSAGDASRSRVDHGARGVALSAGADDRDSRGDFYASTGVMLDDYRATRSKIELRVAAPQST